MKKQKKNKHALKNFTPEKLIEAYEKQSEKKTWTFFDERKHLEDLLCQRFNFLILAFSLFTTAFATIDGKCNKVIILSVGFLVLALISVTVRRAFLKLDIYLKIIHKLDGAVDSVNPEEEETGYNALAIVDKEVRENHCYLGNVNRFMGEWIPWTLIVCYIIGIVAIVTGFWPMQM